MSVAWVMAEPLSRTCDVGMGNIPDCLVARGASVVGGWPFKVRVGSVLGFEVGG